MIAYGRSSSEIQNLQLNAVLDLRVLKKPCKRREDELLAQVKQVEAQSMRQRQRPEFSSSDEVRASSLAKSALQSVCAALHFNAESTRHCRRLLPRRPQCSMSSPTPGSAQCAPKSSGTGTE